MRSPRCLAHPRRHRSGWIVRASPPSSRAELGSRSSWPRTAARTSTTKPSRRPPAERVPVHRSALLMVIIVSPCRYTGCSNRSSGRGPRRHPEPIAGVPGGPTALRDDGRRRLQLRRLPRWHEGRRWRGAVHHHRPRHRRGQGRRVAGAGAEHRLLPVRRGRGPLHHHVRPAGLTDVAMGPRGGGPMNAQQIETLIAYLRVDPDPARGLPGGGSRRPALRERSPPGRGPGRHRDSWPGRRSRTARTRPTARLCSTSTWPAAPRLRPLPHPGLELGRPGCPVRAPWGGTSPTADNAHFPNEDDMIEFI